MRKISTTQILLRKVYNVNKEKSSSWSRDPSLFSKTPFQVVLLVYNRFVLSAGMESPLEVAGLGLSRGYGSPGGYAASPRGVYASPRSQGYSPARRAATPQPQVQDTFNNQVNEQTASYTTYYNMSHKKCPYYFIHDDYFCLPLLSNFLSLFKHSVSVI